MSRARPLYVSDPKQFYHNVSGISNKGLLTSPTVVLWGIP